MGTIVSPIKVHRYRGIPSQARRWFILCIARGSREIAFFVPAAVVVTADQLTQWWGRHHVPLGATEPFLGPLWLTHVSNSGGVFGFTANPILLALLNAAVLLILLLFYRKLSSLALRTALGLVLGGGIGTWPTDYRWAT